jgi:hypothetical protein
MSNLNLCNVCINNNYGCCNLQNSYILLQYSKDKKGNLLKCSRFSVDTDTMNRIFQEV